MAQSRLVRVHRGVGQALYWNICVIQLRSGWHFDCDTHLIYVKEKLEVLQSFACAIIARIPMLSC
jgi:hypothetical protein